MLNQIKKNAVLAAMKLQANLLELREDESGMEIIQILVLLAIGLGLIAIFMGFGDQIISAVTEKVEDFLSGF